MPHLCRWGRRVSYCHGLRLNYADTDNGNTAAHRDLPGHPGRDYARRGVIFDEQHCVTLYGCPLPRLLARSVSASPALLSGTSRPGRVLCSVGDLCLSSADGDVVLCQRSIVRQRVSDVRAQTARAVHDPHIACGSGAGTFLATLRSEQRALECFRRAGGARECGHLCHLLRTSAAGAPLYGLYPPRATTFAAAHPPRFW